MGGKKFTGGGEMKKTISYMGIESITYSFSKYEVEEALIEKYKIKPANKTECYLYEGDEDDPPEITVIVSYQKEVNK